MIPFIPSFVVVQNPRFYYEDCIRVSQNLLVIQSFPLREIAETIDPILLVSNEPFQERVTAWETSTGLPFETSFIVTAEETASIRCPVCPGYILTPVPWITDAGTGFAQKDFIGSCMSCKSSFDREASFYRISARNPLARAIESLCTAPESATARLCACVVSVKTHLEPFGLPKTHSLRAYLRPEHRASDKELHNNSR